MCVKVGPTNGGEPVTAVAIPGSDSERRRRTRTIRRRPVAVPPRRISTRSVRLSHCRRRSRVYRRWSPDIPTSRVRHLVLRVDRWIRGRSVRVRRLSVARFLEFSLSLSALCVVGLFVSCVLVVCIPYCRTADPITVCGLIDAKISPTVISERRFRSRSLSISALVCRRQDVVDVEDILL